VFEHTSEKVQIEEVPKRPIKSPILLVEGKNEIKLIVSDENLLYLGRTFYETSTDTIEISNFLKNKLEKSVKIETEDFTGYVSGRLHIAAHNNKVESINFYRKNRDSLLTKTYKEMKKTNPPIYNVTLFDNNECVRVSSLSLGVLV
jgi:hypothetical protein